MNKRKKMNISLFIMSVIFMYFTYVVICQQNIINTKNKQMIAIQSKIDEENKVKNKLKEQMKNSGSDEYIEKMAREKLGMVKDGEQIFIDINK